MILKTQVWVVNKAMKRIKKKLYSDFVQLAKTIEKRLEQEDTQRGFAEDVSTIISLSNSKTRERLTTDLQLLYKLWPRFINKRLDGKIDLTKVNLLAVKRTQDLKNLNTSNINGSILHTTLEQTKRVIADGIFNGKTYKEIGKEIISNNEVWLLSPARAERIAINTVANAYEQWRREAVEQLKNQWNRIRKIRNTVWDNKVTQQCMENENKWRIELNESRASGDSVAPRATNPRCRCSTDYEIL